MCCSFENLNKRQLRNLPYIDVWPLQVKFEEGFDNTFMLLLQLACVLHMKTDWKSRTTIRLFIVTPGGWVGVSRSLGGCVTVTEWVCHSHWVGVSVFQPPLEPVKGVGLNPFSHYNSPFGCLKDTSKGCHCLL